MGGQELSEGDTRGAKEATNSSVVVLTVVVALTAGPGGPALGLDVRGNVTVHVDGSAIIGQYHWKRKKR